MKNLLKGISKEAKIIFLRKLESGKYSMVKPYEPKKKLNFSLQPDGLFKCKEDGSIMSKEQIITLPGYRIKLEIVGNKRQVTGEEPASGYVLVPYSLDEYLESLLVGESDIYVTFDDNDQVFVSGNNRYTFEDLLRISTDSETRFLMDQETQKKYFQQLEKYC